ncbi:MAG: TonB-dependent receptor, partial [Pseudomonadota bacterium]
MKRVIGTLAVVLGAPFALAEDAERLETTVVEAANESSVSHTITELSADEIRNTSISTIEDVTRYIPGVQVNDSGNRFNDNGFNIRGLEGDAVAVTVDGVSLGETLAPPAFSAYGMYDANRGQVELEHVKTIEITKGPSSVANGEAALAGSVAFTTNDASDFLQDEEGNSTRFHARTGFDTRSDETMFNLTFANRTGRLETLLQYTLRDASEMEAHSDGLDIEGPNREIADPLTRESTSIFAKFAFQVADGQKLGFTYDTTDRETDGVPLSRNSTTAYPTSYDNFRTADENNKERYGLFFEWEDAGNSLFDSLSASYNVQELYSSGITTFEFTSSFGPPIPFLRQEDRSTFQDSTSFNLDFERVLEGGVIHNLVYGLKWENKEIRNVRWDRRWNSITEDSGIRDGYPIRDPAWVPQSERDILNLYVRDDIALNDQLTIGVGLRHDSTSYTPVVDETFEDVSGESVVDSEFTALAGEIQLTYEFAPGHSFLASYTQGYKAPSFQQLYLNTDGSEVITDTMTGVDSIDLDVIANRDLEAEESSSLEFGYKLESDRASLTITAYLSDYDNLIRNVDLTRPYDPPVNGLDCNFNFMTFMCDFVPVVITEDEFRQPQNAGKVETSGFEIDAIYAWTDNIYTSFTYATIDGEYKDSLANS